MTENFFEKKWKKRKEHQSIHICYAIHLSEKFHFILNVKWTIQQKNCRQRQNHFIYACCFSKREWEQKKETRISQFMETFYEISFQHKNILYCSFSFDISIGYVWTFEFSLTQTKASTRKKKMKKRRDWISLKAYRTSIVGIEIINSHGMMEKRQIFYVFFLLCYFCSEAAECLSKRRTARNFWRAHTSHSLK